jgi:hypothetical protein
MNTTGKEGYWLIVQGLRPGLNDGEEPGEAVTVCIDLSSISLGYEAVG